MMVPASTTMVSFSTATWPLERSTRTRAAQASQVGIARSWPNVVAMPSPTSFGVGLPQPAFWATRASTAAWRCAPPTELGDDPAFLPAPSSMRSRNSTGSTPACERSLIHETFERPVDPACPDGAQVSGPKRPLRQIVAQRANALGPNRVPMVGARDRENIVRNPVDALQHEGWRHDRGRPPGRRVVIHRRHTAALFPG